jgi:cyclase
MVLTKRIIPCLDVDHGKVVKGIHFKNLRNTGNPVELAKRYCDEGADELAFLDITASPEKRKILKLMVKKVASVLNIPFTVGGGIQSLEDARAVLCNGADKVTINTSAINNPKLVNELAHHFGKQCIVVAIDVKRCYNDTFEKKMIYNDKKSFWFEVFIYGGSKPTGIDALIWAKKIEKLGAGEILLTSIDNDGTQKGYDIILTSSISKVVNIPIIASGGCGMLKHLVEVFKYGYADAALAASIFHYKKYPIYFVKQFLNKHGVNIRL